jgi:hypothetical protein
VLKKTGIIVAAVAAGVVGLSSLAFATTTPHQAPHMDQIQESGNLSNDCPLTQSGQEITDTLTGGDSFLGAAGAVVNGPNAPVSAPVAALNCANVNVEDVIDFNSNNKTSTVESTEVEDSGNVSG